jgi:thiol-disulfide isomerase/thioredoxin
MRRILRPKPTRTTVVGSAQAQPTPGISSFGVVTDGFHLEAIVDSDRPCQLRFELWDGRRAKILDDAHHRGQKFLPATIVGSLGNAVRFPPAGQPFVSISKLIGSMQAFLTRYAGVPPETASLLVAFAFATWFADCLPVAPLLYLLGAEHEAAFILRLLSVFCRRAVLLADIDIAALRSLPGGLHATLLIKQRDLPRGVKSFLLASADRHFLVARGNTQLNSCGAQAFSAHGESVNGVGVRLSISPQVEPLPLLSDAQLQEFANDFQAKLLRYRELNWQRVCDARPDTGHFSSTMRDELRAWMVPLSDFPNLRKAVGDSFSQRSREVEANRLTDDVCLVAEAVLFFCHSEDKRQFFVGELAAKVNDLLQGRHEARVLTDRKVGSLLRELGIHGTRVVKGYQISLSESVSKLIHEKARSYNVAPMRDGVVRCSHCQSQSV